MASDLDGYLSECKCEWHRPVLHRFCGDVCKLYDSDDPFACTNDQCIDPPQPPTPQRCASMEGHDAHVWKRPILGPESFSCPGVDVLHLPSVQL